MWVPDDNVIARCSYVSPTGRSRGVRVGWDNILARSEAWDVDWRLGHSGWNRVLARVVRDECTYGVSHPSYY